jgi:hypothetical protein
MSSGLIRGAGGGAGAGAGAGAGFGVVAGGVGFECGNGVAVDSVAVNATSAEGTELGIGASTGVSATKEAAGAGPAGVESSDSELFCMRKMPNAKPMIVTAKAMPSTTPFRTFNDDFGAAMALPGQATHCPGDMVTA